MQSTAAALMPGAARTFRHVPVPPTTTFAPFSSGQGAPGAFTVSGFTGSVLSTAQAVPVFFRKTQVVNSEELGPMRNALRSCRSPRAAEQRPWPSRHYRRRAVAGVRPG